MTPATCYDGGSLSVLLMKTLLRRIVRERGFAWYGFCQFFTLVFFLVLYRTRVFGREHVPAEGGCLLASTHQSFFDPVLVGLLLGRQIRQLARESLFRNPVFGRLIRSLGAIPIERGRNDRQALSQGIEALRRGHLLLVFPEGTRTRDGTIGPLKPGIFLMARRAGVPIVPVAVVGAYEAWPRNRALPSLLKGLRVGFGPPLDPARGRDLHHKVKAVMEETRKRLLEVRI